MHRWKELKRFREKYGGKLYKAIDHYFFRKRERYGIIKRTKVSTGSGKIHTSISGTGTKNYTYIG